MNNAVVCQEGTVLINGLNYAYKEWKSSNTTQTTTPMLALHGWLDNASSFDHLIPELFKQNTAQNRDESALEKNFHIVALDLAGHGLSDHRHVQAHYNIWNDLIDLALIADSFGWKSFSLVGHSRGALIGTIFAATLAERINKLILLDGFVPMPVKIEDTPAQLSRHVRSNLKALTKEKKMPSYKEKKEALKARCRAAAMTPETAIPIVERGLYLNDNHEYQWRSDPKLTLPSAIKFSHEQNNAFVKALKAPTLLLAAEKGLANILEEYIQSLEFEHTVTFKKIANSSHHFHLEKACVSQITEEINKFIKL